MAKPSKDEFLMQAIETVVDMAAQSTERIADLLPADLFAAPQQQQAPVAPAPPQPDAVTDLNERRSLYSDTDFTLPAEDEEEF